MAKQSKRAKKFSKKGHLSSQIQRRRKSHGDKNRAAIFETDELTYGLVVPDAFAHKEIVSRVERGAQTKNKKTVLLWGMAWKRC